MLENYLPILIFLVIGLLMGLIFLVLGLGLGKVLGHARGGSEKRSAYECGFKPFEDARIQFDVRYYLVAILFIIFDLEIAFLFPWSVVLPEQGLVAFVAMLIFLAVLVVGFIYEWSKGALEWD